MRSGFIFLIGGLLIGFVTADESKLPLDQEDLPQIGSQPQLGVDGATEPVSDESTVPTPVIDSESTNGDAVSSQINEDGTGVNGGSKQREDAESTAEKAFDSADLTKIDTSPINQENPLQPTPEIKTDVYSGGETTQQLLQQSSKKSCDSAETCQECQEISGSMLHATNESYVCAWVHDEDTAVTNCQLVAKMNAPIGEECEENSVATDGNLDITKEETEETTEETNGSVQIEEQEEQDKIGLQDQQMQTGEIVPENGGSNTIENNSGQEPKKDIPPNDEGGFPVVAVSAFLLAIVLVGAAYMKFRGKRTVFDGNVRGGGGSRFGSAKNASTSSSSSSRNNRFSHNSEVVPLTAATGGGASSMVDDEEWGWEDSSMDGDMELSKTGGDNDKDLQMAFAMTVPPAAKKSPAMPPKSVRSVPRISSSGSGSSGSGFPKTSMATSTKTTRTTGTAVPRTPGSAGGLSRSGSGISGAGTTGSSSSRLLATTTATTTSTTLSTPATPATTRPSPSISAASSVGTLPPMKITSLGKKSTKSPAKPKPKPKSEQDDLFASMGLAARPTFSKTVSKPKSTVPSPSSTRNTATSLKAIDTGADWDDDGDLDDLFDD